jgi:hypothetical protein
MRFENLTARFSTNVEMKARTTPVGDGMAAVAPAMQLKRRSAVQRCKAAVRTRVSNPDGYRAKQRVFAGDRRFTLKQACLPYRPVAATRPSRFRNSWCPFGLRTGVRGAASPRAGADTGDSQAQIGIVVIFRT